MPASSGLACGKAAHTTCQQSFVMNLRSNKERMVAQQGL
jgi:hypothetical protein